MEVKFTWYGMSLDGTDQYYCTACGVTVNDYHLRNLHIAWHYALETPGNVTEK